jgi:hypothetical protein
LIRRGFSVAQQFRREFSSRRVVNEPGQDRALERR